MAIELFKMKNKVKSSNNIDLIIMDMYMSEMNGDDATREVCFNNLD